MVIEENPFCGPVGLTGSRAGRIEQIPSRVTPYEFGREGREAYGDVFGAVGAGVL